MSKGNDIQVVQPEVSKVKFEREIKKFKKVEQKFRKKGVLLLDCNFPIVTLAFAVTKIKPTIPIAYSVRLDFTNYDLEPPSITFIDLFTNEVLKRGQIPMRFMQISKPEKIDPRIPIQQQIKSQDLLQGSPDMVPFFCMPGVKEYHNHPYHSGDSWFLYRTGLEGQLITLIDQLYGKSIPYIQGLNVNLRPEIKGFQIGANLDDLD